MMIFISTTINLLLFRISRIKDFFSRSSGKTMTKNFSFIVLCFSVSFPIVILTEILMGYFSLFSQSVYPLAKIAADFNSATFNSILQNFCEQKFDNFWLKFVDKGLKFTNLNNLTFGYFQYKFRNFVSPRGYTPCYFHLVFPTHSICEAINYFLESQRFNLLITISQIQANLCDIVNGNDCYFRTIN
jgi:hypothetical protein